MGSTNRLDATDAFPYPSYRPHQKEALEDAATALWRDDIETVVLNLPTGIGKSAINTALCRQAENAFLTTPQKALRTQLEQDRDLNDHYSVLRARDDYMCTVANIRQTGERDYTCLDCPINRDDEESCLHHDNCPYWSAKDYAMGAKIAVLTFSYLVIDNFLPKTISISTDDTSETAPDAGTAHRNVSFGDRELLVVDECHKLEDQVASLHAGFSISPFSLPPDEVYGDADFEVGELPDDEPTKFEDVRGPLNRVFDRTEAYIQNRGHRHGDEPQDVTDCRNFCSKYKYCRDQVENGRDWVVHREPIRWDEEDRHSVHIQPVDVDDFLRDFIWSRADKFVLSTATMPFSDKPSRWLERLGLDPERARVIQYPMPFPVENRRVFTNTSVGKMSDGGYEKHRDDVIEKLDELSEKHSGENGLIHTASYDRARELAKAFPKNSIYHSRNAELGLSGVIDRWQASNDDMLFSPAATDGVDLPGDKCRWQVLVKVPYPQPSDPRVRFLLDDRGDWDWYYEITCQQIQQSVGRGVRSMDDHCSYYVLDHSFLDVVREASVPNWFKEAVQL